MSDLCAMNRQTAYCIVCACFEKRSSGESSFTMRIKLKSKCITVEIKQEQLQTELVACALRNTSSIHDFMKTIMMIDLERELGKFN